jgi:hypothetical protein
MGTGDAASIMNPDGLTALIRASAAVISAVVALALNPAASLPSKTASPHSITV